MNYAFEPRLTIILNGVLYTAGILTHDVFEELAPGNTCDEGWTDTISATIYISDRTPDHRRPAVFWHEVFHGCFGELGQNATAALFGCAPDKLKEIEENVASFVGPVLSAAIPSAKLRKALAGPIRQGKTGRKLIGL